MRGLTLGFEAPGDLQAGVETLALDFTEAVQCSYPRTQKLLSLSRGVGADGCRLFGAVHLSLMALEAVLLHWNKWPSSHGVCFLFIFLKQSNSGEVHFDFSAEARGLS